MVNHGCLHSSSSKAREQSNSNIAEIYHCRWKPRSGLLSVCFIIDPVIYYQTEKHHLN